jgi:hypothetical protein
MDIKEMKTRINEIIIDLQDDYKTNGNKYDLESIKALETLLVDNDNKDKVIELMAEQLAGTLNYIGCFEAKEIIIEFENKAKEMN